MDQKQRIVFISHSSYDKDYVACLVELLRKQGIGKNQMLCSSYPGYGIPSGHDIFDFLRSRLVDYDPYVLFVISKEYYYMSPACLNEMGAAWVLGSRSNAILLPGTKPSDMRGALGSSFLSIVLEEGEASYRLTELRDDVLDFLSIGIDSSSAWEYDRDKFLDDCAKISHTKRAFFIPGIDIGTYLYDLVERQVSISHSLRRALIIARQSGDDEDTRWISAELTGYESSSDVPSYRRVRSAAFQYSGLSGALSVKNAALPLSYLDQESLEAASNAVLLEDIESLEKMLKADGGLTRDLSALIPVVYAQTQGGCQCTALRQVLPSSVLGRIIAKVEDRLMSYFASKAGQLP